MYRYVIAIATTLHAVALVLGCSDEPPPQPINVDCSTTLDVDISCGDDNIYIDGDATEIPESQAACTPGEFFLYGPWSNTETGESKGGRFFMPANSDDWTVIAPLQIGARLTSVRVSVDPHPDAAPTKTSTMLQFFEVDPNVGSTHILDSVHDDQEAPDYFVEHWVEISPNVVIEPSKSYYRVSMSAPFSNDPATGLFVQGPPLVEYACD